MISSRFALLGLVGGVESTPRSPGQDARGHGASSHVQQEIRISDTGGGVVGRFQDAGADTAGKNQVARQSGNVQHVLNLGNCRWKDVVQKNGLLIRCQNVGLSANLCASLVRRSSTTDSGAVLR